MSRLVLAKSVRDWRVILYRRFKKEQDLIFMYYADINRYVRDLEHQSYRVESAGIDLRAGYEQAGYEQQEARSDSRVTRLNIRHAKVMIKQLMKKARRSKKRSLRLRKLYFRIVRTAGP